MSSTGLTENTLRGTGIGLMVVTTMVVCTRAVLRIDKKTQVLWDEIWLIVGYLFFMVVTGVYVNKTDLMFRLMAVEEGRLKPYPSISEDVLNAKKIFFFTSMGLWLTLWSIKFSLMAFYKRLIVVVQPYLALWWIVLGYCVLTLILSIVLQITACPTLASWFRAGGCNAPNNIRQGLVSFWQAFAVDLTTDLLIMLLPIGLIRNLQIPLWRKCQIGSLFALGTLVIIASIIRVVQVGTNRGASTKIPPLTWLALWSIIESSVAIMVGCGPGLYRKAKAAYSNTSVHLHNNRGYFKASESKGKDAEGGIMDEDRLPMKRMRTNIVGRVHNGDSEEELVGEDSSGRVKVAKSITVNRANEYSIGDEP